MKNQKGFTLIAPSSRNYDNVIAAAGNHGVESQAALDQIADAVLQFGECTAGKSDDRAGCGVQYVGAAGTGESCHGSYSLR